MSSVTYNSKWHCSLCIDSRQGGRDENQDCYGYKETPFGFLVVVCDGMGGGPAGANASNLAVQSVIQKVDKASQASAPEAVLKNAVVAANDLLRRTIREHSQLVGMGTTCVAALFAVNKVIVTHVGDSRLYQFRNGNLLFKTADHSVVGEMVRRGEITEEEARRAENSNVITRSLGISDAVEVDTDTLDIIPGDLIVLCTDGVWGMLPERELTAFLCRNDSIDSILPDLLDRIELLGRSKSGGDYDNLSLGIVHINRRDRKQRQGGKHSWFKSLIAIVLLLSIGANIYFFTTKDESDNVPPAVYDNADSQKETIAKKETPSADEDGRLERQFARRREQDYKDSMVYMREQIVEKTPDKQEYAVHRNHIRLLNRIADDVKSLDTPRGGDAIDILKEKRAKQQQIIKDFEHLRKNLEKSRADREKCKDISVRLSGDEIIATQKNGASTRAAKQVIAETVNQLNTLRQKR